MVARPDGDPGGLDGASQSKDIMAKQSLLKELIQFAMREKKWWLIPLLVILVLLGALIIFAQSSAIAPFLYPFF
jgi:hypothetical protein